MKTLNSLAISAIINIFTITYSMEVTEKPLALTTTSRKSIFSNEKKIITMPAEEAAYSSYLSILNEAYTKKLWSNVPTNVVFEKKDIKLFQRLLHTPNLYHTLKDKPYYQALRIAEQFKAPLLYAELLSAKQLLPKEAMTLITQNYISLHNMPDALIDKLRHREINALLVNFKKELHIDQELPRKDLQTTLAKKNELLKNYAVWSEELAILLSDLMQNATIPQAVLLSLLCTAPKSSRITMELVPSTPGFNAFTSLLDQNTDQDTKLLLLYALPINTYYKAERTDKICITALRFTI